MLCCPDAFAVFLGANISVAKQEELAAVFLGADIYNGVAKQEELAKHEELPGDLVKEPDYTCSPAGFLGTDIFNTVTGFGKREDMKKFVKKTMENEYRKKLVKEEEVFGEETEESIELNRRIDKFKRRRERSKQLKKREHDKKLYDAKKLAAKLARTI